MSRLLQPQPMPIHGGDIASASQYFNIPEADWLDLSTGVNPKAYPIPLINDHAFRAMPYQASGFLEAVTAYYRHEYYVATNGSQQSIALLPSLLATLPVLLPETGYEEHLQAWKLNGNNTLFYPALDIDKAVDFIEKKLSDDESRHLVIINPNNPTGLQFSPEVLNKWANKLGNGAKLIVDEAFIDVNPMQSVLGQYFHENMIVLRSFGKFFGLAGIRLGFCFSEPGLLERLRKSIGVWDVNGPAQVIATKAFQDREWITDTIALANANITDRKALFFSLFDPLRVDWQTHHAFFSSYLLDKEWGTHIYDFFGRQGILLRLIPLSGHQCLIRVGQCDFQQSTNKERIKQACVEFHHLTARNKRRGERELC